MGLTERLAKSPWLKPLQDRLETINFDYFLGSADKTACLNREVWKNYIQEPPVM